MTGEDERRRRNLRTARRLAVVVPVMLALSFAAVPLYRLFCQVTGYGGTPTTAESAPGQILDRTVTVRLDANTAPGMPWTFRPAVRDVTLRLGETALVFYEAENLSDKPTGGSATFNVTPDGAGVHFVKIACFCFQEQVLGPNERIEMPVTFYVDPGLVDDPEAQGITEITLSYTMFPAELPSQASIGTKDTTDGAQPAAILASAPASGGGAELEK